ncbi:unnamed protein product [Effrenium voratum]|uniref:Uncharacterized protein n=1 Tax=Effrenium voratum TaxID=2562239 RepID=A0AA36JM94_9DINO|nr:unnamed protein product [Effrenium voratum]
MSPCGAHLNHGGCKESPRRLGLRVPDPSSPWNAPMAADPDGHSVALGIQSFASQRGRQKRRESFAAKTLEPSLRAQAGVDRRVALKDLRNRTRSRMKLKRRWGTPLLLRELHDACRTQPDIFSQLRVKGAAQRRQRRADAAEGGRLAEGSGESCTCTVFAQCRGQLILKPEKPDASKVRELLRPSALGQVLGTPTFYDFLTLQKAVASSSKELVELLRDGPYVEVDGKWRLLPEKLQRQILDTALTIVTAQGWDLKDVDGDALLQEVRQALDNGEDSLPSLAVLRKVLVTVEGRA